MPITLHKNITWQLVEDKPVLISRIYADHPDPQRAQHWPDPYALTRAQAIHLVRAIQDTVLHQDHLNAFPPRLLNGLAPTPENAS